MSQHTLHSVQRWFQEIAKGTKTIEGRLTIQRLKVGDAIEFKCGNKSLVRYVRFIHSYSCFAEMVDHEDVQLILPGIESKEQAVALFASWYSLDVQKKKGVLAIGLTPRPCALKKSNLFDIFERSKAKMSAF